MAPGSEAEGFNPTTPTIGRRTHPLTAVVLGVGWSAAAVVGLVGSLVRDGGLDSWGAIGLPAAAVGGVLVGSAIGWVSWWFTRFVIDDTEVRLDSGVLFRRSRRVPYERLQSVDIVEPLVARVLGLAELRLDSAGGAESRTVVRYLQLAEAKDLRRVLMRRAHQGPVTSGDEPVAADAPPPVREVVAEVPPSRVLIGTLLSLDLLFAVLVGLGAIVAAIWFAAPFAALGGLVGVGFWIVRIIATRVLDQWGYRLTRVEQGLRVERGLLSRTSETIPFDRVQGVAVVEPMIWRHFGWRHIQVDIAGAAGAGDAEAQDKEATVMPITDPVVGARVVDLLVPGAVEVVDDRHAPARSGRLFAPIGWRFRWIGADDVAVVSRRGWITRRTSIVPHRKSQSVAVEQGPLQRRLGVATVSVHSPDGPVEVQGPHLALADALAVAADEVTRAGAAR